MVGGGRGRRHLPVTTRSKTQASKKESTTPTDRHLSKIWTGIEIFSPPRTANRPRICVVRGRPLDKQSPRQMIPPLQPTFCHLGRHSQLLPVTHRKAPGSSQGLFYRNHRLRSAAFPAQLVLERGSRLKVHFFKILAYAYPKDKLRPPHSHAQVSPYPSDVDGGVHVTKIQLNVFFFVFYYLKGDCLEE